METVKIYNTKTEVVGEIELNSNIFSVPVNEDLVHQAATTQLANERQILAHTKDRSEVRGGGKKPWRQKGTGRARAGSRRSPIWIGGGVTFGPTNERNFGKKINVKMKKKAITMVLSDKLRHSALVVVESLECPKAKTKEAATIINTFETNILHTDTTEAPRKRSVLIINDKKDENIKRAFNNLANVELLNVNNINIVDLLKYRYLILTKNVLDNLNKIYSKI